MENQSDMSARFSLNGQDGSKILKAFLYSLCSSALAFVISVLPFINVPTEYAALFAVMVPVINTAAVTAKKYFEEKGSLFSK